MSSLADQIDRLADCVVAADGRCIALTGAGISTESGLPDFRGADGLWRKLDWQRDADIRTAHEDPTLLWEFYGERLAGLEGVRPNRAHLVLAAMEQAGLLEAVLTQNVDGLHTAAGSRQVVELHGSLRTAHCINPACGTTVPIGEAQAQLAEGKAFPTCGCGKPLKPSIVLFGEDLPRDATRRAYELMPGEVRESRNARASATPATSPLAP